MQDKNIRIPFNFCARGKTLRDYMITLTKPDGRPATQAADFSLRLTQWLRLQGDDFKGNAEAPVTASPDGRNARVALRCTEETLVRVEPPANHMRGTVYPPKVDPWDTSKW
jgi:hypothetical protein